MIPNKICVKADNSEEYLKIAKELYIKAIDSNLAPIYSAPFVLFCATSLEYLLNNIFIEYSSIFGKTNQKKYAELFIRLGFGAKLLTFLPIVSGNKFQWNIDSFEYKTLCEIIKKRNMIAHGKDFYQDLRTQTINDDSFSINITDMKENNILFSTKNECDRYFKAFESFVTNIYVLIENDKLNTNKLIIPIINIKLNTEKLKIDTT